MEINEVGELVALYLEVLIDPALVDEEEQQLVGLAHPFFLAVLHAIDVKGEQLYIAVPREHQESLGLALARVVEPSKRLDMLFADCLCQDKSVVDAKSCSIPDLYSTGAGSNQEVLSVL